MSTTLSGSQEFTALEKLYSCYESQNYDLILLDEMMPKMNGLSVCREYKAKCKSPKPVIFLSAKSQESDIREFSEAGIGFIPKPFDPTKISEQIIALLTLRAAAA